MLTQKDAGGLMFAFSGAGAVTLMFAAGLPDADIRLSPAVFAAQRRHGVYWTVTVASPLLLNRLKMLLNSCLP